MRFLTAGESVDRIATYCRVEQLFFGLLGGWVADITEPQTKLALLVASDHCAWRAQRWFELLPTAPPGADAFLVPTPREFDLANGIAAQVGTSQVARIVVSYELLLPSLLAALAQHVEDTSPVADGPIQRMLAIAMFDLDRDLAAGVGLPQSLGSFLGEPVPSSEPGSPLATLASDFAAFFSY